ncbi:MAG: hypothetical protein DHS20C17_26390 [Cyclobacteriaceae bacterium]|nr:MAG: hypothetical protein DHS20C17_26390 [Cyclobacteriaceae bacterium]
MRKAFNILMSFTLILATTGLSISKHYCDSMLVGTSIGSNAESCAMDMGGDLECCDEKTETLILDDDFQISNLHIDLAPEYNLLIAYLSNELIYDVSAENSKSLTPLNTGPPVTAEPIFQKVQSFLL